MERGGIGGACVTAALLVQLAGCSGPAPPAESDPLELTRAYFEAIRAGDWSEAARRAWLPDDSARTAEALDRMRATSVLLGDGRLTLEPVEARQDGEWALVVLRVSQRAGGTEARILRAEWLLRRGSSWALVAPSLLAEPEIAARRDAAHGRLSEEYRAENEALVERWLRGAD
jgi:hypothetical protein